MGANNVLDTFKWDYAKEQWVDYASSTAATGHLKLTVTKNIDAGGEVSSGGSFAAGTPMTITAAPSAGFHFVGWKWDDNSVSTSPTLTFSLTKNVSVQAVFLSIDGLSGSLGGNPGN